MDSPYVFVSYCSHDTEVVHRDVKELQRRGLNVWIDEPNLDKTKTSWKDDALEAIADYNCSLVLFYVSSSALLSEPCLNELEQTISETALSNHINKSVPFIAVEAEPIDHIGKLVERLGKHLRQQYKTAVERNAKARILARFQQHWFPADNERVRIRFGKCVDLKDYYNNIERAINNVDSGIRLSADEKFLQAFKYIVDDKINNALPVLEQLKANYAPALLLMTHLMHLGFLKKNESHELWKKLEEEIPVSEWLEHAKNYEAQGLSALAATYYSAYGERLNDARAMFKASQLWCRHGSREQCLSLLKSAAILGNEKSIISYNKLKNASKDIFRSLANKLNK
jgi:hypothetical protein